MNGFHTRLHCRPGDTFQLTMKWTIKFFSAHFSCNYNCEFIQLCCIVSFCQKRADVERTKKIWKMHIFQFCLSIYSSKLSEFEKSKAPSRINCTQWKTYWKQWMFWTWSCIVPWLPSEWPAVCRRRITCSVRTAPWRKWWRGLRNTELGVEENVTPIRPCQKVYSVQNFLLSVAFFVSLAESWKMKKWKLHESSHF